MDIFSGIPFMAGYLAAWCRVVDDFDWPIWHRAVGVPEGQRPVPTVRPLGRTFGPRFVGGFGSWGVALGCRGAAPVALKRVVPRRRRLRLADLAPRRWRLRGERQRC